MAEQDKGWTNYETWCVHLWLTNDEGSYRYWRETAADMCRLNFEGPSVLSEKEQAKFALADRLKDEVTEGSPITEATMYQDMLLAALSEVNWGEIADAFLEDLDDYTNLQG